MNIGIAFNSFARKKMLPEEKELKATSHAIGKHLLRLGHNVQYFDMDDPHDIRKLCCSKLDVVFDTCERIDGDSRGEAYVAALLEYLNIPHTRTRSFHIALGINKVRVKLILSYYHIATPRFQVFHNEMEDLHPPLKFPLFVKGVACENSISIDEHSLVMDRDHLRHQVKKIRDRFDQDALVEEFIGGREFSVGILPAASPQVLPTLEIEYDDLPPDRRFLDYKAKWITRSDQFRRTVSVLPHDLTLQEQKTIRDTALRCYSVLGLDSYARIDMRYDDHTPYVLEINQNPSINEAGSGYVRSCEKIGLDYTGMVAALLQNALGRTM